MRTYKKLSLLITKTVYAEDFARDAAAMEDLGFEDTMDFMLLAEQAFNDRQLLYIERDKLRYGRKEVRTLDFAS